jgi:threonine/homoserine/homoserine lactone efflux protein
MHHEFIALAGIIAALSIGAVSPGPSFVMVARTAVAASRLEGVTAALGMGAGGAVFGTIALLGLQAVLLAVPAVYVAFKVLGGLYLAYLGWRIFKAAQQPLALQDVAPGERGRTARSFWLGFATQVSNPKTAIVYASVFAAFLPPAFSAFFAATLITAVFFIEAGWYTIAALALSARGPRTVYLSYKTWVDRLAGTVMMGLGLRLVTTAHHA